MKEVKKQLEPQIADGQLDVSGKEGSIAALTAKLQGSQEQLRRPRELSAVTESEQRKTCCDAERVNTAGS